MEGLLNPGWESILPVCGEIVGFPEGQLQPRAPRPDWPRAGGGGALGRRDWGSENAGMKVICLLYYIRQPGSKGRPGAIYPRSFPPRRAACVSFNARPAAIIVKQSARIMMILRKNYRPPIPSPCSPGTLNAFRAMLLRMV